MAKEILMVSWIRAIFADPFKPLLVDTLCPKLAYLAGIVKPYYL